MPASTKSSKLPMSTVINKSAGERAPSALTRSIRPSLTNTVLTLISVSAVKASSSGMIRPGSRVVYKLTRSEEHTSELQSRPHLVCRLLLEKKKYKHTNEDDISNI